MIVSCFHYQFLFSIFFWFDSKYWNKIKQCFQSFIQPLTLLVFGVPYIKSIDGNHHYIIKIVLFAIPFTIFGILFNLTFLIKIYFGIFVYRINIIIISIINVHHLLLFVNVSHNINPLINRIHLVWQSTTLLCLSWL